MEIFIVQSSRVAVVIFRLCVSLCLGSVHAGVLPVGFHELLVGAVFADGSVGEDQDRVGHLH